MAKKFVEEIPTTIKRTVYKCEKCDFKSEHESYVDTHYAENHCFDGQFWSNGEQFLHIPTVDDFDAFYLGYNYKKSEFCSPGWYWHEITEDCDGYPVHVLRTIDSYLENIDNEIRALTESREDIQKKLLTQSI